MPPRRTGHDAAIAKLRAICMALPEVEERNSHGEPAWFVRGKKQFACLADHHHDDRFGFWCAAPPGAQDVLIRAAPDSFFRPPYVGVRGWLGVRLDVPVDWAQVADIVNDAWCCVAPAKLLAQFA